mmetsp:Transcript_3987/g.7662  ORF Transcript_3987/g.7662 Transcript_3987/m.7662 type:complete len:93 (+) Transcript_3987:197-475(+)
MSSVSSVCLSIIAPVVHATPTTHMEETREKVRCPPGLSIICDHRTSPSGRALVSGTKMSTNNPEKAHITAYTAKAAAEPRRVESDRNVDTTT